MFIADADIGDILSWALPFLLAAVCFGVASSILASMMTRHEIEKELKEKQTADEAEQHRLAGQRQAALEAEYAQRRRQLEDEARASLDQAVVQVRDAAQERYQPMISPDGLESLEKRLCDLYTFNSYVGRVLTVRVYCLPTGWVGIEWMLDPNQPMALKVICKRDGYAVFAQHAYKGTWGAVHDRGHEYRFDFHAMQGSRDLEDGLEFRVKIPDVDQWPEEESDPTPPPKVEEETCEQQIARKLKRFSDEEAAWEQGKQAGYQRIDATDTADAEKKRRKARLDARIAEERGEQG
jgi:hypothetical protein